MTFSFRDNYVGAQPIAATEATAKHEIGTRVKAYSAVYGEGEFIYLKGVASTIVGSVVIYDSRDASTILAVAASRGQCAVAMSANVANQYGWYQIFGASAVKVAAAVVAGTPAYSTATAGQVDDAVAAGSMINNMVFKTADGTPSAGLAVAEIGYPALSGAA